MFIFTNCRQHHGKIGNCMIPAQGAACTRYWNTSWFLPPRFWKRSGKHRRLVTVFLMWSETVSVINLQTLKSMLKIAQKCDILNFKVQKFSALWPPSPDPTLFVSPQFACSSQCLWIRHCDSQRCVYLRWGLMNSDSQGTCWRVPRPSAASWLLARAYCRVRSAVHC